MASKGITRWTRNICGKVVLDLVDLFVYHGFVQVEKNSIRNTCWLWLSCVLGHLGTVYLGAHVPASVQNGQHLPPGQRIGVVVGLAVLCPPVGCKITDDPAHSGVRSFPAIGAFRSHRGQEVDVRHEITNPPPYVGGYEISLCPKPPVLESFGYTDTLRTDFSENYYHVDGGGNITYIMDSSQSMAAATYKYDPFGILLAQSGTLASANVYRFSSKEFHSASSLYYYGFRFYDPNLQRWPSRDPLAERGGWNIYSFIGNNPANFIDELGLYGNPVSGPNGPVGPSVPDPTIFLPPGLPQSQQNSVSLPDPLSLLKGFIPQQVSIAQAEKRFLLGAFPPFGSIELELAIDGAVVRCVHPDGRSGLMYKGEVSAQLDGGIGTIIGGRPNTKLHKGKNGGIVPRDIDRDRRGSTKDLVGKNRDGAFEGEGNPLQLGFGSCEKCEDNLQLVFSVGAYGQVSYGQVSYGLGMDQITYELGKYSIPGGGQFTYDVSVQHQWGLNGLGARIAVYGKGAVQASVIIK